MATLNDVAKNNVGGLSAQQLKTRYLIIRLDITDNVNTFSNVTITKYIYAYSGSPLSDNKLYDNSSYQKAEVIIEPPSATIGMYYGPMFTENIK